METAEKNKSHDKKPFIYKYYDWHAFYLLSYQRQVVSLDEEADNPAFTENWKKLSGEKSLSDKLPWTSAYFFFTSHSTKIWKSKPISDKLKPLYPHRRTSSAVEKTRVKHFCSGALFFSHQVNSWQSVPQQIIPNPSIYFLLFTTSRELCHF